MQFVNVLVTMCVRQEKMALPDWPSPLLVCLQLIGSNIIHHPTNMESTRPHVNSIPELEAVGIDWNLTL